MFGKRFLVTFSLLGCVCVSSYADGASSTDNTLKLSIPTFQPGFEFNFAALLLKPSAGNLDYAIYNKALPLNTPGWQEEELRPGYAPAFELGARYIFRNGNDLSIDWTHLNSTTTAAVGADGVNYFVGPNFDIGPDAANLRGANGSVNFKYDVVNLDIGQFVDFGQHLEMRFFGGLSSGFLRQDVKTTFNGVDSGPFTADYDNYSNFTGVGPRFGIGANYHTASGFGFLGEAAASALIGISRATMDTVTNSSYVQSQGYPNGDSQRIADQNSTQVVPGFDAKLGVNYQHAFSKNTLFTVEGGYQAAVYLDAINEYEPASLVDSNLSHGVYVATMSHNQYNYGVHGPFLKVALKF